LPLFVIPHPLGFEIGPQTIRKLSPPFVSAVARLSDLVRSFRRRKTLSLSGHLDCSMNFRSPHIAVGLLPIARRDLRHAVQANRTSARMNSAFDWRQMVHHARTSRTAPSLDSRSGRTRFGSGGTAIINLRRLPGLPWTTSVRLTFAKPALAYAMRWIAN